ncbi:MAG: RsfS/YbeB/iojap family protein [Candidatus Omnitrophica bacterium]|nr:RsfS/YbeB/iojap family protein [Candidatus Omnitrophota bacterium]
MESLALAKRIALLAADKKGEDIVVLDMSGIVNYCDYFVICSGSGSRHVKAIGDGIDVGLRELGIKIKFKQGMRSASPRSFTFGSTPYVPEESKGNWVLLDSGNVVVHVFEADSREFYGLEHLWQEARKINWEK